MIRWLARVLQEQDADTLWLQSKFFSGKTEVRKESLLKSFKDEFVCLPLTISCTRESYYCCHPFVVYLEVNFSIWEYLFLVFNTLLTPLFLLFNENVTVKWSDSKTNRTLKGYLFGYDFMMTFREILNSSLLARACSWLLHSIFLKYQIIFFLHFFNLQLNGEAYHIETALKPYHSGFEIKAQDLCCLINGRLRNTFLIVYDLACISFFRENLIDVSAWTLAKIPSLTRTTRNSLFSSDRE